MIRLLYVQSLSTSHKTRGYTFVKYTFYLIILKKKKDQELNVLLDPAVPCSSFVSLTLKMSTDSIYQTHSENVE